MCFGTYAEDFQFERMGIELYFGYGWHSAKGGMRTPCGNMNVSNKHVSPSSGHSLNAVNASALCLKSYVIANLYHNFAKSSVAYNRILGG